MTTLHTVKVQLSPADALEVLQGRELRAPHEDWQMITAGDYKFSDAGFSLEIFVDGCPTGETLVLHADGTWSMMTHVVLGDTLPQEGV